MRRALIRVATAFEGVTSSEDWVPGILLGVLVIVTVVKSFWLGNFFSRPDAFDAIRSVFYDVRASVVIFLSGFFVDWTRD